MEHTKGLEQYIREKRYREALGLPGQVTERYEMLAQGEYNRNYVFIHPETGQKLVLRVNFGSQMHLQHQIEYEYGALRILESSGRTPVPLYVDGKKDLLPYGVMVMEYLSGRPLHYETELLKAADILADIHSTSVPEGHGLIEPRKPLRAILEECEEMVKTYMESPLGIPEKKEKIRSLLNTVWKRADDVEDPPYKCCVNTELNSNNFLMNDSGKDYLVDWEKPLYSDPAQDLGHFLAPTTTFWKTDVILKWKEMQKFIDEYLEKVDGRFDVTGLKERTNVYIPVTCLRGITWCAMAWVQYQDPDREIYNAYTYQKLEAYLSDEFLEEIRKFVSTR